MVILNAINELDYSSTVTLTDENDLPVLDQTGFPIRYNIAQDAYDFLSGANGMIYKYAYHAEVNANAIRGDLEKYGPIELKRKFLSVLESRCVETVGDNILVD